MKTKSKTLPANLMVKVGYLDDTYLVITYGLGEPGEEPSEPTEIAKETVSTLAEAISVMNRVAAMFTLLDGYRLIAADMGHISLTQH